MTITDEMVETAQKAWWGPQRDDYHPYQIAMRAALEAVAPLLVGAAMREAAHRARQPIPDWWFRYWETLDDRAQELDPQ